MVTTWRRAMAEALYGERGFFTTRGPGPAGHFRTSVHASAQVAGAIGRLLAQVDAALGRPDRLDVVDVGAGRGELLRALAAGGLAGRVRLTAVELAPRPDDLPAAIAWRRTVPARVTGLIVATEWLDNVPLDVVEVDPAGTPRYVLVDPATGAESAGEPVSRTDADWLARWWPATRPGERAEIGRTRDAAWAATLSTLDAGLALCVDYGHLRDGRPPAGTLTGFRHGRQVEPVPDGSRDLTAHVAIDSVADTGPGVLLRQRAALRALGVSGARPPLELAGTDPARYLRALAAAGQAAELTDAAGLGGHWWLLQPVGIDPAAVSLCAPPTTRGTMHG